MACKGLASWLASVLLSVPTFPQSTPDYCGANSAAQFVNEGYSGPYSHYLNPAHPGVAQMLGVSAPQGGLAAKTYGETLRDRLPLVDWQALVPPAAAPVACYDSGWSVKEWLVPDPVESELFCYRRRDITLPSGASLTLFAAFPAPGCDNPPDPLCAASARNAWFTVSGYQGGMFMVTKTGYCPDELALCNGYADPYDGDPQFGVEIETPTNLWVYDDDPQTPHVNWILAGTLEHEALLAGATVVLVKPSTGFRPFLWHYAQLVEAGEWLDSSGYSNPPTPHRKFVAGGSYNGSIALGAAIHMPWLFQGAIAAVGGPDHRTIVDWGEAGAVMSSAFKGVYWGGFVRAFDAAAGTQMQMLLTELEKGYGGMVNGQPTGTGGVNVDLGGLALLSHDLNEDNLDKLQVPLVLLHGDEDHVFYTFSGRNLETDSGGLVIEKRVPLTSHGDFAPFVAWNLVHRVVHELIEAADFHNPSCALPASPAQIGWEDQTTPDELHRSNVFRNAVVNVTAVAPAQPDPSLSVSGPLATPAWKKFDVTEGLGAMSNLVFADVDGDPSAEIVGCTARGDVVKLTLTTGLQGGLNTITGVRRNWRVRMSDYLGPTELHFDAATHSAVALPNFGPLLELDLVSDLAPTPSTIADNQPTAADDYNLGTWLRGLRSTAADTYVFLNDEGELVRVAAGNVTKHFLEGGPGPLEVVSGQTALYCSAHGNVKRIDDVSGAVSHPSDVADISDHLYASPMWVRALSQDVAGVRYLVGTERGVFGLTASLQAAIEIRAIEEGSGASITLESCHVVSASGSEVTLIGPQFGAATELRAWVVDLTLANPLATIPAVAPTSEFVTSLPAQIAALVAVPGAFSTLHGVDPESGAFPIRWLASLHSGQIALIGEAFVAGGAAHQELGEPYGSAFGFVASGPNELIVLGRQNRTWKIDPTSGAVLATQASDPTLANKMNQTLGAPLAEPPSSGALKLSDGVWGLFDGGAPYGNGGNYIAMPFAKWLPFKHLDSAVAGVQVAQAQDLKLGLPNPIPSQTTSNYFWQSVSIVSPKCVGGMLPFGTVLEPGNAAIWADLDGDGDRDLVSGTHGGRVLWFQNSTANPADPTPVMPATGEPTGELAYGIATGDLGWAGDLGSKILSMDSADLDGDGRAEVVLGVECATDPDQPEHHTLDGMLYVVELNNAGAFVIAASLPLSYGPVGVRLANLAGGTNHDVIVGFATGQLAIVGFDPLAATKLSLRYQSGFVAPMLGAYGALAVYPVGGSQRIVAGSAGGLFAFDVGP